MAYATRRGKGAGASDVAHAWAHQHKNEMRKGNVFFDGPVIYSYGRHFPMAVLLDNNTVAITTEKYSVTTSAHQSIVAGAVSHMHIIYCPELPTGIGIFTTYEHSKNISEWMVRMKVLFERLQRARKKSNWTSEIQYLSESINSYVNYFNGPNGGRHEKVTLTPEQQATLLNPDIEVHLAELRKQQELDALKLKEKIDMGMKLHPVYLAAFRNWNEVDYGKTLTSEQKDAIAAADESLMGDCNVRLRTDSTTVYTTKGIKIPIEKAKAYYNKYLAIVRAGGCMDDCGYQMAGFEVKKMTADQLIVGCHSIPRSEIDYVASKLGWLSTPETHGVVPVGNTTS